jgi:hypothetical protein
MRSMEEREPVEGADQDDETPLQGEELTLPDGRRLILYSRSEDVE